MGYRSDVVIAVDNRVYTKHFLTNTVPNLLRETAHSNAHDAMYWYFEKTTWYDTDSEVNKVTRFLYRLEDESSQDFREPYGFLRIGEEWDDIEQLGNCSEYDIEFVRSINFPHFDETITNQ